MQRSLVGSEMCIRDSAKAGHEIAAVVMLQRMVRPGHRTARKQQDQRIDQRQIKRIKCLNTLWRPYATYGKKRTVKEGPEEGDKEHYLGCDEQHHPVAHANLHNRCVICLLYTSPSPRDYAASRMPSSA